MACGRFLEALQIGSVQVGGAKWTCRMIADRRSYRVGARDGHGQRTRLSRGGHGTVEGIEMCRIDALSAGVDACGTVGLRGGLLY